MALPSKDRRDHAERRNSCRAAESRRGFPSSPTSGDTKSLPSWVTTRITLRAGNLFTGAQRQGPSYPLSSVRGVLHREAGYWTRAITSTVSFPHSGHTKYVQYARTVHQYIDAWFNTAVLSGENLSFLVKGRGRHSDQICRWIYTVCDGILHDANSFFAKAKKFAHACRSLWILKQYDVRRIVYRRLFQPGWLRCKSSKNRLGLTRSYLQWSFLGRALPRPNLSFFPNVKQEMLDRVTSSKTCHIRGKEVARVVGSKAIVQNYGISLQSRAGCQQVKRPLGRRHLYALALHRHIPVQKKKVMFNDLSPDKSSRGLFPLKISPKFTLKSFEASEGIVRSTKYREALWHRDHIRDQSYDLVSEPVPVPERGWKVRMVSRSCGFRVARSESFRKSLLHRLRQRRAFAVPQSGQIDHLPAPVNLDSKVFSADLSAATDYISRTLLEEICAHIGVPPDLVTGGVIRVDEVDYEMTRGTLMGIPLSFPFLNLVHLYVCDRIGAQRDTYYIMGDDLIAVWPQSMIDRYMSSLFKLTGMVPNASKSFIGLRRGLFCERAYHLCRDGLRANRQYVSVRGLTPFGRPVNKGEVDRPGLPWEVSPLLYLSAAYERIGHSRAFFAQDVVCAPYARKVEKLGKRHGISMYLPMHLGGAGLIPPKGNFAFSSQERDLLHGLLAGDPASQTRLRAVYAGTHKMGTYDRRSADRLAPAANELRFVIDGEGLGESLENDFSRLREWCDDIAAAEFRPTPEDVPLSLWFRNLSKIPVTAEKRLTDPPKIAYNNLVRLLRRLSPERPPDGETGRLRLILDGLLPNNFPLRGR